ncbi:MAG: Gfo/Idh/MocA family oxidoreductase [Chitinophagaceae bacterium]|nr:Gfo/Idh/MocA family oxidoreductase [Chitinophagaceae bacterium]
MKAPRFVLIGCGRIGEKHAQLIEKYAELVAVVDTIAERAEYFSNIFQVKRFSSIESFLAAKLDIDIAVICTPNGLHASQAILCLEKGMDVVVEKPIALFKKDIDAIAVAIIKSGKRVFPIMQNRFNTALIAIQDLLRREAFGSIYSFQINCFWNRPAAYYTNSWHGDKYLDGGVLYTQLSHFIDMLTWFFGDCDEAKGYVCKLSDKELDFEDTGAFILKYPNGVIGSVNYTVNTEPQNIEGSFMLHTEKGTIKIGGTYLNRVDINTTPFAFDILETNENKYNGYKGSGAYHEALYQHLLAVYQLHETYYTSLQEAKATIRTIEMMYLSATVCNPSKKV